MEPNELATVLRHQALIHRNKARYCGAELPGVSSPSPLQVEIERTAHEAIADSLDSLADTLEAGL